MAKAENEAERFAKELPNSNGKFPAEAATHSLNAHRRRAITESLNEIYDRETSTLDPALMKAQLKSLGNEDW